MKYVIDTHSLVWYFVDDSRLSKKVDEIIQQAEQGRNEIIIPVVVLLETLDICDKKKIDFKIEELFEFIDSNNSFSVIDLTFNQLKQMREIGKGLDLHDRVIYAIAKSFGVEILTRDSAIQELTKTVW